MRNNKHILDCFAISEHDKWYGISSYMQHGSMAGYIKYDRNGDGEYEIYKELY